MNLNFKVLSGLIALVLIVGIYIGYRFAPTSLGQPPTVAMCPSKKEAKKTERKFDASGKLSSEVVVESVNTPMPQPKPRFKITLMPVYSFQQGSLYYGALYEKRYDLPIIGEAYVGVFINNKLEAGLSLSKEFY